MIELTIKTLDSTNHPFSVSDETTVEQLKERVKEQLGIETDLQRLIFCGRVLQDEKKLSDYDIDGKVIHLVQRAPPGPEARSSSASRRGRHAPTGAPAFNGPPEDDASPYPDVRRMMQNLTPDFVLEHQQQMSLSPTAGRLEAARRLIVEIKSTLTCLRAHLNGDDDSAEPASSEATTEPMDSESTPAAPAPEPEPDFDDYGEETSANLGRPPGARRRVARMVRTRQSQPRHLGMLIDELDDLHEQFAPHRANYTRLLRSANEAQPPEYTDEEQRSNQRTVDLVTDLMHTFAHAYHVLSDVNYTVGNPRLSAEAVPTRQVIPMQAQINVISAARRPASASATAGSSAAATGASDAGANTQAARATASDIESLFRGLPGVEMVMSMEEIPQAALGNLGNLGGLAARNGGNSGSGQAQGGVVDGGVYFAPIGAFATGIPAGADLLQNIVAQVIRQGLVPGMSEGITIPASQLPAQFQHFLEAAAESAHDLETQAPPTAPATVTTETQTAVRGVDRDLLPGTFEAAAAEMEAEQEASAATEARRATNSASYAPSGRADISAQLATVLRVAESQAAIHSALAAEVAEFGQATRALIDETLGNYAAQAAPTPQAQAQAPPATQVPPQTQTSAQPQTQTSAQPQTQTSAQPQTQTSAQPQAQAQARPQRHHSQGRATAGSTHNDHQARQQQPNIHMRRAASTSRAHAQALALANMFYDRYLQCDSAHARRRLQRRRDLQQQQLEVRDAMRVERNALQSIEYLTTRRPDIKTVHICTARSLLNGSSTTETWLNAFMLGVSRQMFLGDLLQSQGGMPALVPHEFQDLRVNVLNYVHNLLAREGNSESDNAFQSVSDYLVGSLGDFINNMHTLTPMRREVDAFETIRAYTRSRLPAFIALVTCNSSTTVFVARFYSMFQRIFTEMCAIIHHICYHGENGLRIVFRKFMAMLMAQIEDELAKAALMAISMANLSGALPNVEAQFDSVAQFIRHTDGSMPNAREASAPRPPAASSFLPTPSPSPRSMHTPTPMPALTPISTAAIPTPAPLPATAPMPTVAPLPTPTPMEVTEPRQKRAQETQTAPIVAPSDADISASRVLPRHIHIINSRRQILPSYRSPALVPPTVRPDTPPAPPASAAPGSSSSGDSSGLASPSRLASSNSMPDADNVKRESTETPETGSNVRFTPPVMILQNWGNEWVPVLTHDHQNQAAPLEPYSDAYLTGMPQRKRRCVRNTRPASTLDGFMDETIRAVSELETARRARAAGDSQSMRAAFREHMRTLALSRASASDDFDLTRFASAARFLNGTLSPEPRRYNQNDSPDENNRENGV